MIINMNDELRDYTYITNLYKCISNYNLMGHQIGRKVGDMLEILTMGVVYQNDTLKNHLTTEGKLEGFTSAEHKVEFGFFKDPKHKQDLFGAIECKCVGVEETKFTSGHVQNLKIGDFFQIPFSPAWMEESIIISIKLLSINKENVKIEIFNSRDNSSAQILMGQDENIKLIVDENHDFIFTTPKGDMLTEIPTIIRLCKTIKLKQFDKAKATFTLWNCLTGPQTIEKAKQASLVAMDLRKKVDGSWGLEELDSGKKKMTFIHVLCEYSHWEAKSRNVIKTCIDHNLIVPDAILIHAFKTFEEMFGTTNMLGSISKKQFDRDENVRNAINSILAHFNNHILFDIATNEYVKFDIIDNKLTVTSI